MKGIGLLVLALALAGCAHPGAPEPAKAPPTPTQGVRGVLTHAGAPLAGAVVFAYRRESANLLGPADFASAPSGRDGAYAIDLVEGSYWLVARKRVSGSDSGPLVPGDLQKIFPHNPVRVAVGALTPVDLELDEMRELMFSRTATRGPTAAGIKGRILDDAGRPVSWVFAIAYTSPEMRRVPDFTSAMTAADGRYVIYLPQGGRYWVGARKHIRERPEAGEPFGLYAGSPDHSVVVGETGFTEGIDIVLTGFRRSGGE